MCFLCPVPGGILCSLAIILYNKCSPKGSVVHGMHGNYTTAKDINKFLKKYLLILLAAAIISLSLMAGGCAKGEKGRHRPGI